MSKLKKLVRNSSVTTALLVAPLSAMAALPAGFEAGLTSMQSDATSMIDAIWPFLLAIAGAFLAIKIFKRVTSKL